MNSGNLMARYGLALALTEAGRNEGAIKELREVLSRDPTKLDARKKLMSIFLDKKEYNAVLREGEKALAIAPHDREIHKLMDIAWLKAEKL